MWGRRKTDVPVRYDYTPLPARLAPNPAPQGTECADRAQDPERLLMEPCNQCGHALCPAFQPCDICWVTVRIRALENR